MSERSNCLQGAIDYIEENLCDDLKIENIAYRAFISPFYFQKIFSAVCNMTVGEYVRGRRMTLAAAELTRGDVKIIDLALKYGYDSPDSFTRAFVRFHGLPPSRARQGGVTLRCLAPMKFTKTRKGDIMEYKILRKEAFSIVGVGRRFSGETSYVEIPKFWDEYYESDRCNGMNGMFGACIDCNGGEFDYYIADLYQPWQEIPEGYKTVSFDSGEWAVFPWHGECPEALQTVNTQIWSQWLPSTKEYKMRANYNLEVYLSDTEGEIWLPVKKA